MKTKTYNALKTSVNLILGSIFVFLMSNSCTEIFEPSLSDEEVILIAPPNNLVTPILTHSFWWNKVEYAEEYNFQLVSPSFNLTYLTIADTLTSLNNITYTLYPGTYQWRVSARSSSSQTNYSIYSFIIDSSSLISGDSIQLKYPLSNDTTNNINQKFEWYKSSNADSYRFNLYYKSDFVYSTETTFDTLNLNLHWGDGTYEWEVRGQNVVSATAYKKRSFYIDITPPGIPTLLSPLNNIEIYDTIQIFRWNRVTDKGSSLKDNLIIYENPELTQIVKDELLENPFYENYLYPGVYYWQVRTLDAAGNSSPISQFRKLTVTSTSISAENVILLYPLINDTLNNEKVLFQWLKIKNAQEYKLNLYRNSILVYTMTTPSLSSEIKLIWGEGSYKWEVKAINAISNTVFSQRVFYNDITSPQAPELSLPTNNFISSDSLQRFSWVRPENFGSSISDSIYIYNDSTLMSLNHKKQVKGTAYEYIFEHGKYFWRVRSVDKAGNLSGYSQVRKLTIVEDEK